MCIRDSSKHKLVDEHLYASFASGDEDSSDSEDLDWDGDEGGVCDDALLPTSHTSIDSNSDIQISKRVAGALKQHASSLERERRMKKSKSEDRATVEGVIDRKTRVLLFSWVNTGLLSQVNGCISTGKEAHVFNAVAGPNLSQESAAQTSAFELSLIHISEPTRPY
eukprot:TRINITY_DN3442_c0_g1_i1.p1 TRINITY_DN3442_c0_g1~~TRINITY_DN3442_c0_g1_i1.p1  ORF type:complete len:166 (+),score=54.11 TRINITY_DN3442_c0_g1_i1:96-593(+)